MTTAPAAAEETVLSCLRWLMACRLAIATFLLGMAAFIEVKGGEPLAEISLPSLFIIILSLYIISLVYFWRGL